MTGFPGHSFDGTTLIEDDEKIGLLLPITTRGQLNLAEAKGIDKATLKYLKSMRKLKPNTLLKDSFAKKFHKELFGEIWDWAGKYRKVATMPGIDWHQIPLQLNQLMQNTSTHISFLQDISDSSKKEELVAEFAYKLVWIHPFRNGNGRWSRAYADLLADALDIERFGWGSSIESEHERHLHMVNALGAADISGNIEEFLAWAKK
ncbi:MAG: hypothetical protein RL193_919 [Actinomycetota bacterium]|jgi:Fic-DOC domain mobile mystery protein B